MSLFQYLGATQRFLKDLWKNSDIIQIGMYTVQ